MAINKKLFGLVLALVGGGALVYGVDRAQDSKQERATPTRPYSYNGVGVDEADYPYMVKLVIKSLSYPTRSVCGGIAIRKHWVLTAAHCVLSGISKPTHVVPAGFPTTFLEFDSYCHTQYSRAGDVLNDLALLEVPDEDLLPWTGTILAPPSWPSGKNFVGLGWGKPSPGKLLRSRPMPHAEKTQCENAYPGQSVQSNEICAGSAASAPCQLDSGGALFTANVGFLGSVSPQDLVGVVSQADDDCVSVGPGIYTGIDADSLRWIDDVIRNAPGVRVTSERACRQ